MFARVWIIQDAETGEFLRPSEDGDVCFTQWIREAGLFEDEEGAFETAMMHCSEGFHTFSFYRFI